jgi:hypothetical protein
VASIADICNMALSHIGSEAVITSIAPTDGTMEAGKCAIFYPIARAEILQKAPWTWCKTRVELAQVTNPSSVWAYAYGLPSDCLSPLRVLQVSTYADLTVYPFAPVITSDEMQLFTERGSAEFEVEGGTLLTHEPDAVLLYVRDITDTTKFSPACTVALSYLLASYLAGPILKGTEGVNASAALRRVVFGADGNSGLIGEAERQDANNNSSETHVFVPSSIRARG